MPKHKQHGHFLPDGAFNALIAAAVLAGVALTLVITYVMPWLWSLIELWLHYNITR